MKKILATLLATALSISALVSPVFATEEKDSVVLLGDSIAVGYSTTATNNMVAHNYGEIIGDYLDYDVKNHAVVGDTTTDLIDILSSTNDVWTPQLADISNAEVIIVSIGGNDVIDYTVKYLIENLIVKYDPTGSMGFYNEGYSALDFNEDSSMADLQRIINLENVKNFLMSNVMTVASPLLSDIKTNLCNSENGNDNYIKAVIQPNLEIINNSLKQLNPDAEIIFQTVYNPLIFPKDFLDAMDSTYRSVLNLARVKVTDIVKTLNTSVSSLEGASIADVYTEFNAGTSTAFPNGHVPYFVDNTGTDLMSLDIHPNQRGHLAIAALILNNLNNLHDDNGLLSKVYNELSTVEKLAYPELALATYMKVAGNYVAPELMLGDVNGDNDITAVDASITLIAYAQTATVGDCDLSDSAKVAADVNKDGSINSVDASNILSYYAYMAIDGTGSLEDFLANRTA